MLLMHTKGGSGMELNSGNVILRLVSKAIFMSNTRDGWVPIPGIGISPENLISKYRMRQRPSMPATDIQSKSKCHVVLLAGDGATLIIMYLTSFSDKYVHTNFKYRIRCALDTCFCCTISNVTANKNKRRYLGILILGADNFIKRKIFNSHDVVFMLSCRDSVFMGMGGEWGGVVRKRYINIYIFSMYWDTSQVLVVSVLGIGEYSKVSTCTRSEKKCFGTSPGRTD